uniref:Uncharacterized protein n=1 Tax=Timema cristinae TaxID=61476 RepID=A0A7R9CUD1_TIMCR|nr:unnamed protein product [Timema cristinae]
MADLLGTLLLPTGHLWRRRLLVTGSPSSVRDLCEIQRLALSTQQTSRAAKDMARKSHFVVLGVTAFNKTVATNLAPQA